MDKSERVGGGGCSSAKTGATIEAASGCKAITSHAENSERFSQRVSTCGTTTTAQKRNTKRNDT